MIFHKLLKANVLRAILLASSVAVTAARCTAPVPCLAHPIIADFGDDDSQDSSQEPAERPLESDPMDFSDFAHNHAQASKLAQRSTSMETDGYRFQGTVTRTDGLPDSQPVRNYFVQPFRGRSESVTCVQVAPGIQTCN